MVVEPPDVCVRGAVASGEAAKDLGDAVADAGEDRDDEPCPEVEVEGDCNLQFPCLVHLGMDHPFRDPFEHGATSLEQEDGEHQHRRGCRDEADQLDAAGDDVVASHHPEQDTQEQRDGKCDVHRSQGHLKAFLCSCWSGDTMNYLHRKVNSMVFVFFRSMVVLRI